MGFSAAQSTVNGNGRDVQDQLRTPVKRLQERYQTIWLSCAALTIPFVIISALVLGLVFHLRVPQGQESSSNLSLSVGQNESGYMYTNISPTRLTRVASLYTNALAYIGASAVVLSSYPLALFVLKHSRRQEREKLLTPYQFTLMLRLIENGGIQAMRLWIKYMRRPKAASQRTSQPGPAVGVGLVAIITAILG
jgi:hypothetical protein